MTPPPPLPHVACAGTASHPEVTYGNTVHLLARAACPGVRSVAHNGTQQFKMTVPAGCCELNHPLDACSLHAIPYSMVLLHTIYEYKLLPDSYCTAAAAV